MHWRGRSSLAGKGKQIAPETWGDRKAARLENIDPPLISDFHIARSASPVRSDLCETPNSSFSMGGRRLDMAVWSTVKAIPHDGEQPIILPREETQTPELIRRLKVPLSGIFHRPV
ncbi:hypothetical protein PoB_001093700 [Plakobranchus ocellatus]|uniref:Uncharacterized protein n=1 Tax=Plakobranchus ocellatus TaxID=259542 RepID=A0AAV3YPR8_9GAST|nr:hypothetical protein PoB_001093700 [Plakobranchus ocellatus]